MQVLSDVSEAEAARVFVNRSAALQNVNLICPAKGLHVKPNLLQHLRRSEETDEKSDVAHQPEVVQYWRH